MAFTLDKVCYISLDYRTDKHQAMETACALCEIPYGVIERFPARYGNDCEPTDLVEILDLMAEDGFPEWKEHYDGKVDMVPSRAAVMWSKMALLRYVRDSGRNMMVFSDTSFPYQFLYRDFLYDLNVLSGDYELNGLFLGGRLGYEVGYIQNVEDVSFGIKKTSLPDICFLPHCYLPFSMVLTPFGAGEILELLRKHPFEHFFNVLYHENFFECDGYFCAIPAKVKFIGHLKYPFSRSDKLGWVSGVEKPHYFYPFPSEG